MMDDNPFRSEQARRQMQRLAEQHYRGNVLSRDRTDEALDTILHAIEGLKEAVRQMNASLVEIRRQVSPDVVVVEFPANALKHSR